MNYLKRIALSVLLVTTSVNGSEFGKRVDLEKLLTDPVAMRRLVIEYEPGDDTVLLVYGTGIVVKQPRPRFSSNDIVPTCTGRVDQEAVREVIQALITRHFFDLPSRSYVYMTVSSDDDEFWKALKLHSITIDDGKTRASRQFADGIYEDRKQILPADFAAIEEILQRIKKSAISGKPCHMAPGLSLPPLDSPQPSASPSHG